jgi:hypothetical protein
MLEYIDPQLMYEYNFSVASVTAIRLFSWFRAFPAVHDVVRWPEWDSSTMLFFHF